MEPKIEEQILARLLFYPASNRLVAHLYDTTGHFKYRATVEGYEAGSLRAMLVSMLSALRATVESDPML